MATSKSLFRRVQALRAQCRAFSGSLQVQHPAGQSPHADMMGLFSDVQSRASSRDQRRPQQSSQQQPRTGGSGGGMSYLQRQLAQRTPSQHELETGFRTADFDAAHTRRYVPGDIISPHDLSFGETQKWRFDPKKRSEYDVFDVLGIDPMKEYKNFGLLGEFVSDMGRIKDRKENGLRARNQRKIAKAVRRSIGLGLVPSVSRHPEILERALVRRNTGMFRRR